MSTPGPTKLPGVIDTLSDGFRTVNRQPWLIALPVLLDLFNWLGPRLSAVPLVRRLVSFLEESMTATAGLGIPNADAMRALQLMKSGLDNNPRGWNLFSLLSLNNPLGMPSLALTQDARAPAWVGSPPLIEVSGGGQFLGLAAVLLLCGIVLGAIYLGLAAQVVRTGAGQPAVAVQRAGIYAVRFVALIAILLVVSLFLGLPAGVVIALTALFAPVVASLFVAALWAVVLWVYFYLFFAVDALFISDVGPLRAIGNSIAVVRMRPASALGLFLASIIISLGMPHVWGAVGASELGLLVSIVGNAYIGTGLVAASMIFYRDRITAYQAAMSAGKGPAQTA